MSPDAPARSSEPPTPAPPLPDAGGEAALRTALVVGPVLTCVGIAWTAIAPSDASSAAVLVGLLTAIAATHRFGRRGADAAERAA